MRALKSLRWSIALLAFVGVLGCFAIAVSDYELHDQMTEDARAVFVSKDVVADILPPPMYLIEMRLVLSQAVEGTVTVAEARKSFDRLVGEYDQRVDHWTKNPPYGLEKQLLGRAHSAARSFIVDARSKVIEPLTTGDRETARSNLAQVHKVYLEHRAGVDETVRAGTQFAESSIEAFDTGSDRAVSIAAGVALFAVLLLVALGNFVYRNIIGNVRKAVAVADRVAEGDISQAIDATGADELGQLLKSLQRMQANLVDVVGAVRLNAEGVATASAQIAQGNNDLSMRTEQQASALEETAASMEQLSSTVERNADNARQANQLAQSASAVAVQGGDVVARGVDTMKGINESSKRIADIISVIDGIAFQTNILALNAAVEAARAGEQGRGFAVVASEVRSLAGRSADAAKQIKALITASVERVEQGTALVDQAGATMSEVVASIKRVTTIMGEISSASTEQSAGVAQVGGAVSQLDQATQQNAALVEQSAAAAESLRMQAQQLVQAVAVFKLGAGHAPTPAARVERRGPDRAKNVVRPPFAQKTEKTVPAAAPAARTGTDDDWTSF